MLIIILFILAKIKTSKTS